MKFHEDLLTISDCYILLGVIRLHFWQDKRILIEPRSYFGIK
jgi:hypothetical protein